MAEAGYFICAKLGARTLRITEDSVYQYLAKQILEHQDKNGYGGYDGEEES